MNDIQGGVGHAASQMVDEMQRAQHNAQPHDDMAAQDATRAFMVAMEDAKKTRDTERTRHGQKAVASQAAKQAVQQAQQQVSGMGMGKGSHVQSIASMRATHTAQRVDHASTQPVKHTWLTRGLNQLLSNEDQVNKIMHDVLSGRQFAPPDVVKMQAEIFHHVQELEFTTKAIEKSEAGIKLIFNTHLG